MRIQIDYQRGAGATHQKFTLTIEDAAVSTNHTPQLAENLLKALLSDSTTWVLSIDDQVRRSGEHNEP